MASYLSTHEFRNIKLVCKDTTYWADGFEWRELWLMESNGDVHIIKVKLDAKE